MLLTLTSSVLYSQVLKPELRNIYEVGETHRDSVALSLEEYNKILQDSNRDKISSKDALVRSDNTVMMYYEIPVPEESEDAFEVGLPFESNGILDTEFKSAESFAAMTNIAIDGLNFDSEAALSGFYHIPPDPSEN